MATQPAGLSDSPMAPQVSNPIHYGIEGITGGREGPEHRCGILVQGGGERLNSRSHNSTNREGWCTLELMANDRTYFYVGHCLLALGLIGFIVDNNPLAIPGLCGALICF